MADEIPVRRGLEKGDIDAEPVLLVADDRDNTGVPAIALADRYRRSRAGTI